MSIFVSRKHSKLVTYKQLNYLPLQLFRNNHDLLDIPLLVNIIEMNIIDERNLKMKKMNMDVVIIGGSAAGLVAAMTAKSNYPEKDVMVIRKEEKVMIPCGIPYIFGTLGTSNSNILPDGGLVNLGVRIKIDTVERINPDEHTVETADGSVIAYEKLIIATGSTPFVPKSINGTDLENVYTVPKSKIYLDKFNEKNNI